MAVKGFERFSRKNFSQVTGRLLAVLLFVALGEIVFGYDTGSFAGVQAIPAFVQRFGDVTSKTGVKSISARLISLMSSLAFVGKAIGTFTAGPFIERFGHRWAMFLFSIASFVGVAIEATSKVPGQFIAGRIVLYFAVGIIENAVPTYQSELAPAAARGAFVGAIQIMINIGGLVSAGINRAFSTSTEQKGWLVPVTFQVCLPFVLMCGLPFIPDSPRWLLSKGRREDAIASLKRVRSAPDVAEGVCEAEVAAIEEALAAESNLKLPWADLFKGTNRRRTEIACVVFFVTQFCGQAFMSQYGPRVFKTVGLGNVAFTYSLISSGMSVVACIIGIPLIDTLGRRTLLLWGAAGQAGFMYMFAGVGGRTDTSKGRGYAIEAAVVLFGMCFAVSWAPIPYILGAELGTGPLREKTMALSSSLNVLSAFIVSFTLPYLLNAPYAALGAKVGWIYGSFSVLMGIYAFLRVPETKGRSLEELDELFERGVPARKFVSYESRGAGHQVTTLEGAGMEAKHEDVKQEDSKSDV